MFRLFETIRITDGVLQYLNFHENRINRARKEIWKATTLLLLEQLLNVPSSFSRGEVRCKFVYGKEIESIDYSFYRRKKIGSLMLIPCDMINYRYKYTDRSQLEKLVGLKEDCDDIIIVKDGFLTDSSMANLIFFDGKNWFTPATPLLQGTCRERLLGLGLIRKRKIRPDDLKYYTGVKLINAMRYPEESEFIPVSQIRKNTTFAKKK